MRAEEFHRRHRRRAEPLQDPEFAVAHDDVTDTEQRSPHDVHRDHARNDPVDVPYLGALDGVATRRLARTGIGRDQQFLDDIPVRRAAVDPIVTRSRLEQQVDLVALDLDAAGLDIVEIDKMNETRGVELRRRAFARNRSHQSDLEFFRVVFVKGVGEDENNRDRQQQVPGQRRTIAEKFQVTGDE